MMAEGRHLDHVVRAHVPQYDELDHLPFLPESRVLALISWRGRAKESTATTTCVRALPRDLQGHGAPCGEVVRRDAPAVVQIIVLVDVHLVAVRYGSDSGALASALRWLLGS